MPLFPSHLVSSSAQWYRGEGSRAPAQSTVILQLVQIGSNIFYICKLIWIPTGFSTLKTDGNKRKLRKLGNLESYVPKGGNPPFWMSRKPRKRWKRGKCPIFKLLVSSYFILFYFSLRVLWLGKKSHFNFKNEPKWAEKIDTTEPNVSEFSQRKHQFHLVPPVSSLSDPLLQFMIMKCGYHWW